MDPASIVAMITGIISAIFASRPLLKKLWALLKDRFGSQDRLRNQSRLVLENALRPLLLGDLNLAKEAKKYYKKEIKAARKSAGKGSTRRIDDDDDGFSDLSDISF